QKLEEKYAAADTKRQAAQVDENAAPEALRQAAAACGEAAIAFGKLGDYADARTRSLALWDEIAVRETVYTGSNITVAVRNDGRVLATEYTGADEYYDDYSEGVSEWSDVVAIAVSEDEIFGLKADHT